MCCLRKGTMRPWIDCCVQWELFVQVWSSLFGPSPWHGIVGGSFEWWEPISSTSYWPSGPNSLGWNARSRGHFRNSEGIYGRRPTQWAYRVIGENCHWQLSVQRPQVQNNLILRVHIICILVHPNCHLQRRKTSSWVRVSTALSSCSLWSQPADT